MTMLKRFSAIFIVAAMVSALGCASKSEPQNTGAYMGDSWVTTKVKTAILNEPSLKVAADQRRDLQEPGAVERLRR